MEGRRDLVFGVYKIMARLIVGVDYSSVSVRRKRSGEVAAFCNDKLKRGPFKCAASGS
jgi:hypothetical protein